MIVHIIDINGKEYDIKCHNVTYTEVGIPKLRLRDSDDYIVACFNMNNIVGYEYRYAPPVNTAEKVGHWINAKVGKMFPSNDYKCSECGNILNFDGVNCGRGDANYCPNCGAKM